MFKKWPPFAIIQRCFTMILAIIVCLFDFAIIHMRLKNALIEIQQFSLNDNYHAQTKLSYNLSITTLRFKARQFKLAAVLCIGGIHIVRVPHLTSI